MLRSAGNPKISVIETERGNRSIFSAVLARIAIASRLMDKPVIISITTSETEITLYGRARCRAIPVGSWMLLRDTSPVSRIPGIEADNETESGTGALRSNAVQLTANSSALCVNSGMLAGSFGDCNCTSRAAVVIRSQTVVSYLSNGQLRLVICDNCGV